MHAVDVQFALFDAAPGVFQVDLPLAHRLHFGAEEFDAGLKTLENKVVVICFFVPGNGLQTVVFFLGHERFSPRVVRFLCGPPWRGTE